MKKIIYTIVVLLVAVYNTNEDVSNWSKLDLAPGTGINGFVVLPEPFNLQ